MTTTIDDSMENNNNNSNNNNNNDDDDDVLLTSCAHVVGNEVISTTSQNGDMVVSVSVSANQDRVLEKNGKDDAMAATAVLLASKCNRLQRQRRAPQRFVARPSKQGWNVEDGDKEFLERKNHHHHARFDNNHHSSFTIAEREKKKRTTTTTFEVSSSITTITAATATATATSSKTNIALSNDLTSEWTTMNNNNNNTHPSGITTTNTTTTHHSSRAFTQKVRTTNNNSLLPTAVVRTTVSKGWKGGYREGYTSTHCSRRIASTAAANANAAATTTSPRRKSAISRRPRPLRPTEKMIAWKKGKEKEDVETKKKKKKEQEGVVVNNNNNVSLHPPQQHCQKQQQKQKKKRITTMNKVLIPETMKTTTITTTTTTTTTTTFYPAASNRSSGSGTKNSLSSSSSSSSWKCTRCNFISLSTKRRCSSCQGWRGGKRERLLVSSSSSLSRRRRSNTHHHQQQKQKQMKKMTTKKKNSLQVPEEKKKQYPSSSSVVVAAGSAVALPLETSMSNDPALAIDSSCSSKMELLACSSTTNSSHDDEITQLFSSNSADDTPKKKKEKKMDDDASSEQDYDDVVCCLCKCAVDFSDKDYFLPPSLPTTTTTAMTTTTTTTTMMMIDDERKSTTVLEERTSEEASLGDAKHGKAATVGGEGDGSSHDEALGVNADHNDDDEDHDHDDKKCMPTFFQLPYRFYDPTNALLLCDGPAYSAKKKQTYQCHRAFHQHCHFVPVLSIPRGPWRCLICKLHDEMYLKKMASRSSKGGMLVCDTTSTKSVNGMGGSETTVLSDVELKEIFQCRPILLPLRQSLSTRTKEKVREKNEGSSTLDVHYLPTTSRVLTEDDGIASVHAMTAESAHKLRLEEQRFESLSAPLKARLLHAELTTRSCTVIKSALSSIRIAEHSLRSITETSKARKALAERIENVELGLPQELCQSVMRIALCKTRIREMIFALENVIRCRPPHPDVTKVSLLFPHDVESVGGTDYEFNCDKKIIDTSMSSDGRVDPISELMQWYYSDYHRCCDKAVSTDPTLTIGREMSTKNDDDSLLHHMFPEGSLARRRYEPRTAEAHLHNNMDNRGTSGGDDDKSVTSISLDDLVCWTCHGTDATDENDMLLCDGVGCCRAFHMNCMEPKLSLEDVHTSEDDHWFCPLCTAHATLIHYTQSEYLGDDIEEAPMSPSKKRKHSDNGLRLNIGTRIKEWETANDVFVEAPFELRVAEKFKENVRDTETQKFLEEALGITTHHCTNLTREENDDDQEEKMHSDSEDDDSDDEFDYKEEEIIDDESLAEEVNLEKKFAKEKIGRDELDALSCASDAGYMDGDDVSSSGMKSDACHRPRRSARKRCTLVPGAQKGEEEDVKESSYDIRSSDIGALNVANIVRGKRNRSKVDYRKLADVMFGGESDDDAKSPYKPHTKKTRRIEEEDDDGSDDMLEEDCDGISLKGKARKKEKKNHSNGRKSEMSKAKGGDIKTNGKSRTRSKDALTSLHSKANRR